MTKQEDRKAPLRLVAQSAQPSDEQCNLDTVFFDRHEQTPIQRHAPPEGAFSHWLSVEQIRRMQRMRRGTVIEAMESGRLPFEKRGRIRYARLSDVLAWEESRLSGTSTETARVIDPYLQDLAGGSRR